MRERIIKLIAELKKQPNSDAVKSQIRELEEYLKDYFPITAVSREDIKEALRNADDIVTKDIEKIIDELDDDDMEHLASKMADDYIEQLFWIHLRILFQDRFLKQEKKP